MTFRLTCLLIFTLLLASPVIVFGQQASTDDPTTAAAPATSSEEPTTADPPTTAPATPPPPSDQVDKKCPSDLDFTDAFCSKKCVNDGAYCYREIPKKGGGSYVGCCGGLDLHCPTTGLHTKHSFGGGQGTWLYTFIPKLNQDLWYRREFFEASKEGVACPIPHSFSLVDRTVPTEWANGLRKKSEQNDNRDKLKTCNVNADCEDEHFCDAVFNPSFTQDDKATKDKPGLDRSGPAPVSGTGASLRFCFPLPVLDKTKMVDGSQNLHHVEHEKGLKICSKDEECGKPDEICHYTGSEYRNESKPEAPYVKGICVHVDACGKSDAQPRGVLNVASQKCVDDDHCQGAGVSKDNSDYNPHCTAYWKETGGQDRKVCCFEKNPSCRVGKTVTPFKKCKQFSDCNQDVLKASSWNMWCDDGGIDMCCKDLANTLWQCPDLATPLFNEPKCTGVIPDKENSGTCPKGGSRCLRGHCCPALTVTNNGTQIKLGKNLYRTEFPCNPDTAVPNGFSYAFCNPEDKKLVIMGNFHDNGDKMTKVSGKKCTINADCSSDASSVCIYENSQSHVCYFNPLRPLRPPVSGFWKTVLIISLVCGGIFLVLSLVCFVCYRSKSVFDKYKKKGKKGKKGSGSKSSKESKNGGKKGGKKGKKGKKGEESASSKSKKSKSKKSKKDTEKSKSEATTGDGSTSSQMN
ncbi:hypothetical protein CAEBREN_08785 [Caenorhabditis brenneri]|uniref:Domain of unknown function DX domain-containing protein n=1 Tax=Caenorhabditis brenneri TaxID=135651 RepID=G0NWL1_CAEBE|nr:hypothetical protein CAEBREN_08785 [Caenorhabditis brenneri]